MLKLFSVLIFFYATYSKSIDINIYDIEKNKVNILLAKKNENKIQLGLEFLLDTDWKIYWKYPGDVGLGPSLQITEGSKKYKINIKFEVNSFALDGFSVRRPQGLGRPR